MKILINPLAVLGMVLVMISQAYSQNAPAGEVPQPEIITNENEQDEYRSLGLCPHVSSQTNHQSPWSASSRVPTGPTTNPPGLCPHRPAKKSF